MIYPSDTMARGDAAYRMNMHVRKDGMNTSILHSGGVPNAFNSCVYCVTIFLSIFK